MLQVQLYVNRHQEPLGRAIPQQLPELDDGNGILC